MLYAPRSSTVTVGNSATTLIEVPTSGAETATIFVNNAGAAAFSSFSVEGQLAPDQTGFIVLSDVITTTPTTAPTAGHGFIIAARLSAGTAMATLAAGATGLIVVRVAGFRMLRVRAATASSSVGVVTQVGLWA